MNKVLCMFSGGIDSTGVVYQILTEPQYKNFWLHIHHIHILNNEGRAEAERLAANQIIGWLSQHGFKFDYTENILDFNFIKTIPQDMDLAFIMSAYMVRADNSITHITRGRTWDDGHNPDGTEDIRVLESRIRGDNLVKTILGKSVQFLSTQDHLRKKEVWELLPADLRELCWYCRFPIKQGDEWLVCNKCKTCKQVNQIKT